jgi:transposase
MRDLSMVKQALLPKVPGLVLDRFTEREGEVVVEVHCTVGELACPGCSAVARRVHTWHGRRLIEFPAGGRRVVVKLTVRRFFRDSDDCPRRTFVEQVEGWRLLRKLRCSTNRITDVVKAVLVLHHASA